MAEQRALQRCGLAMSAGRNTDQSAFGDPPGPKLIMPKADNYECSSGKPNSVELDHCSDCPEYEHDHYDTDSYGHWLVLPREGGCENRPMQAPFLMHDRTIQTCGREASCGAVAWWSDGTTDESGKGSDCRPERGRNPR